MKFERWKYVEDEKRGKNLLSYKMMDRFLSGRGPEVDKMRWSRKVKGSITVYEEWRRRKGNLTIVRVQGVYDYSLLFVFVKGTWVHGGT